MEHYWEEVMQEALATIKWITGCDCKHDILNTAKTGWLWACHEKKAHEAEAAHK